MEEREKFISRNVVSETVYLKEIETIKNMIETGKIETDGNSYELGYERDETVMGLKYKITDLTTRLTTWRDIMVNSSRKRKVMLLYAKKLWKN